MSMNDAEAERARQDICRAFAIPPRIFGLKPSPRCWFTRRIDHLAIWLTDHGHDGAAIGLWRVFRLW